VKVIVGHLLSGRNVVIDGEQQKEKRKKKKKKKKKEKESKGIGFIVLLAIFEFFVAFFWQNWQILQFSDFRYIFQGILSNSQNLKMDKKMQNKSSPKGNDRKKHIILINIQKQTLTHKRRHASLLLRP